MVQIGARQKQRTLQEQDASTNGMKKHSWRRKEVNDMTERVSTLSIDSAIRIAKIIATAPVARMPMITQLFHQASVDLEGLDELIENSTLTNQTQLIDTEEFIHELTED
jgi:hypothetical protein